MCVATDPIIGWATQFVVMWPPSPKRLSDWTESNQSLQERPAKTVGRTVFSETSEVLGRQEEQALAQNRPPVDALVAVISR